MSNYLAIATVTKALAQILDTAVKSAVASSGAVTQRPPSGSKTACVDVFLYQVTPNAAMRNCDLPTRNAQGQVISRPTSALDLHYLFSFYGDDSKFEPQRMLGAAVSSLLAEPGLTRDRILAVSKDDNGDNMNESNLANALEQVKFTEQPLTLDELSRIWSIFYQVPYVLSVAYKATVVTIESEEPVLDTLPVLQRGPNDSGVETQLGPFPQLVSWHVGEGDDDTARLRLPSYPSARLGTVLTLNGQNLGGDSVVVRLVNEHLQSNVPDLPVTLIPNRPGAMKVSIPNATADASKWVAGIYSVSVVITNGGVARSTNSLPLPFAPQISAIAVGARDGDGNVVVTVTPAPAVSLDQAALLSLPDSDIAASPRALDTDPLQFTVVNPAAGQAVVRLRVDGVDSLQFQGQGTPPKPVLALQTIQFPP
jgi:Pvc16 N-terminal domain